MHERTYIQAREVARTLGIKPKWVFYKCDLEEYLEELWREHAEGEAA